MKWNIKHSVMLSRAFIGFFAILLLAVDVAGFLNVSRSWDLQDVVKPSQLTWIRICVYACSVPAWAALWELWQLMGRLSRAQVFTPQTVKQLRIIAWCCFMVALISFVCAGGVHFSIIVVSVAAALMGLIVRMVKNVLEQAMVMKNELDYTV